LSHKAGTTYLVWGCIANGPAPALFSFLGRNRHISLEALLCHLESIRDQGQMALLERAPDKHSEEPVICFCALPSSYVLSWQMLEQSSAQQVHKPSASATQLATLLTTRLYESSAQQLCDRCMGRALQEQGHRH